MDNMINDYIVKIETEKLDNIKEKLNIVWQSKVFIGLVIVESELSTEDIMSVPGVISCRKSIMGKLYWNL